MKLRRKVTAISLAIAAAVAPVYASVSNLDAAIEDVMAEAEAVTET